MTKELDIATMINSKEIITQSREHLEPAIKNKFLCAIGQKAPTEITKTVRGKESCPLPSYKLYTLFRLHYRPEKNVQNSRADIFDIKRINVESAADIWKKFLEVEKGEFQTITVAELLPSKITIAQRKIAKVTCRLRQ